MINPTRKCYHCQHSKLFYAHPTKTTITQKMDSIHLPLLEHPLSLRLCSTTTATAASDPFPLKSCIIPTALRLSDRISAPRRSSAVVACATVTPDSPGSGLYRVGDFMTRREDLHVVNPTTTVDQALEMLVENRITGFPVINYDWKLVGLVSDYDLLALDSISGGARNDTSMFPEVDRTWKTFNEVQKLLSKTNGKLVGDLMSLAPVVVHETTNLEDAARILLETKYRRLPVVDSEGKLVGIITRGNVVRAALQIKRETEREA